MEKYLSIILFMIISTTPRGLCENIFCEGTTWTVEYIGTHNPDGYGNYVEYKIQGDTIIGNTQSYKLYSIPSSNNSTIIPITFLRSSEDKVWFWHENSSDWYLLYDFSLKIGEGCYVYTIPTSDEKTIPSKTFVVCSSIETSSSYGNKEQLIIHEYNDDSCEYFIGEGKWMIGIGSTKGIIENNNFEEMDGFTSRLIKVSSFGEEICAYNPSNTEHVTEPEFTITINNKKIKIPFQPSEHISIYSTNGTLVKKIKPHISESKISLQTGGSYVIVAGDYKFKIMISSYSN